MTKAVMMFCLSSTVALAGTVHFDPPSISITPGTPSVSFETRAVPESLATFDSVIFIFGSLEGLGLSFQPDQSLFAQTTTPNPAPPSETGIYDYFTGGVGSDFGYGAIRFSSPNWTSLTLGVLIVDTSTLMPGDVRQILVSPELESQVLGSYASALASGTSFEPLRGAVTITVVPEPATIAGMMLCLVATVLGRRCACRFRADDAA